MKTENIIKNKQSLDEQKDIILKEFENNNPQLFKIIMESSQNLRSENNNVETILSYVGSDK